MEIRETNIFEVLKVENTGNISPQIILNNSTLNASIQVIGGVLEAQYTVDDKYLLFITEGNPLEEALYIYLIDNKLNINDTLELSANYTSGIFNTPLIIGLDSIRFSFFEKDDNWLLTVSDYPKVSFFKCKYPVQRNRSFLSKVWLQLQKS
ncbi:hypothetical protein ACLKMI_04060 [Pseudoalteromonas sp. KJ71-7]|uniref:hypothetical protein n=1 Tax=Pseudoalteromonas sp. KJ71-7 TaxID=3391824 RepID=UPI0039B081DC